MSNTGAATPAVARIPLGEWLEIQKAKLLTRFPFYGLLLTYLQLVPSDQFPVAATDGVHIFYNPAFWAQELRDKGQDLVAQGLLLHETLHPALGHLWREGSRDHRKWNAAGDYVINLIVTDLALQLPYGALLDEQYRGMSEEEVYAKLPDPQVIQLPTWLADLLAPAHPGPGDGRDAGVPTNLQDLWRDRLLSAANAAKLRGSLPAGVERLLDRWLAPRQDLRSVLQQFVMPFPADYDWRKPDRRYLATYGLYLPSLNGEQVQNLVVAIDLSGSIGPEEMAHFFAVLRDILGLYDRVEATVMTFDAAVRDLWQLTSDSPLPTSGHGGGGTATEPVFEKIRELDLDPYALVVLTDGYASYPETPPFYPVLWVLAPNHETPPWGQSLVLEEI